MQENAVVAMNKTKKKVNWWKVLEYSLPAVITIGVCLIAMIITGVAPFGGNSVGYIDYDDGLVPAYTYLWDVFHGNGDALVAWELGAGGSFVSSAVLNGFLSPISWLIAIFPRTQITFGIMFLVVIKLALMATTAYICFKKFFPNVNKYVLLMFAMFWTFSGWMMTHWTNIGWLDLLILLPLLIMSLSKLEKEGKILWFVIILSYLLMLSYYISYMILVGLVVVATIYLFTISKNRKRTASCLFFGIIISILISAVAFIPSMLTSLQGHRFSGGAEATISDLFSHFTSKTAILLTYALPFVFFAKLMGTYKKDKKNVLFFMLSFIVLSIGVLIEPINEMWHTGSYYSFPFRYSFLIVLFTIFASLYYINKYIACGEGQKITEGLVDQGKTTVQEGSKKKLKINWTLILLPASIVAFIVGLVSLSYAGGWAVLYQKTPFTTFMLYALLFLGEWGIIECCLKLRSKKFALGNLKGGVIILALIIVQICSLFTGFLTLRNSATPEQVTNALVVDTSSLDRGYKIKDREFLYNYNFPYLMDYASLSSWIHISSEEQFQGYHMLGYNTRSTVLSSSGGTMLTDVMLGNKYVLSREVLDANYYEHLETFEYVVPDTTNEKDSLVKQDIYLYQSKLNMEKAFVTDVNLSELLEVKKDTDFVENQNALFKAIYGSNQDVMTKLTAYTITATEDSYEVSVTVPVGQTLYIVNKVDVGFDVNINAFDRVIYQGLNEVGKSQSGVITFNVDKAYKKADIEEYLSFASFNTELFAQTHQAYDMGAEIEVKTKGSSVVATIDNHSNKKYALIPYTYLKNMVGENNGGELLVDTAFESFMFVSLSEGQNDIIISYEPQLIMPCLYITIASIVIFIIFALLNWKFKLSDKTWIKWAGTLGACVILLVVGFLVYLKPFFEFFVILFKFK